MFRFQILLAGLMSLSFMPLLQADGETEDGFVPLFNGHDLDGWVVPEGDNGHWKVVDGVIDYDAGSESSGDRNLWTEAEYGDFIMKIDWRLKQTSGFYDVPVVLQDGSYLKDAAGNKITIKTLNADSGVFIRGMSKAQLNIWCWPVGSGEVYGYRNPDTTPPHIRAGVTPRINADNPVGEWNQFVIIVVKDRLTVMLNDQLVLENAELPGLPARGKIALQHHGGINPDGSHKRASSLIQFRNIWIKELPGGDN
jgi:3-keto-disaccharide hydrolase